MWEVLILLVQLKSMSLLSAGENVFIEAMLMYSGCWSRLDGEMQETDLDLNLVWSDLTDDFLFSLLEFLDLDC